MGERWTPKRIKEVRESIAWAFAIAIDREDELGQPSTCQELDDASRGADAYIVDSTRSARELRKHLVELTEAVTVFLAGLDKTMQGPSTVERGKSIGRLASALEMAKDRARSFGEEKGQVKAKARDADPK